MQLQPLNSTSSSAFAPLTILTFASNVQGSSAQLRMRQSSSRILFSLVGSPAGRARFAHAPRWHFDMVQDSLRNEAYEAAIAQAIQLKKAVSDDPVTVLDIGAGSGLLSMMAAR